VGDPGQGWLHGTPPDPRVVAAARDGPADPDAADAPAAFDLFGWPALRPDGTLEPRRALWHTALPADIPLFGRDRVVLLGKSAFKQQWDAGRPLERMHADLRVEAVLGEEETLGWLERIRTAPR